MMNQILSCDWGTSSFRLRLLDFPTGNIVAETRSGMGIAIAYQQWLQSGFGEQRRIEFFQKILRTEIEKLPNLLAPGIPLIISGMASSSLGIQELPYGKIPFSLRKDKLLMQQITSSQDFLHDILLVSGLASDKDAMRGEETILLGCDLNENEDQLFIFPGTHSKHVSVSGEILVDLDTFMTGELFDLLATKSILHSSVVKDESDQFYPFFCNGVRDGAKGNLLNKIFHIRTNQLFRKLSPAENYHYLSGLLIGGELQQVNGKTRTIHLVCAQALMNHYRLALETLSTATELRFTDADKALLAGHCKLAASLIGQK